MIVVPGVSLWEASKNTMWRVDGIMHRCIVLHSWKGWWNSHVDLLTYLSSKYTASFFYNLRIRFWSYMYWNIKKKTKAHLRDSPGPMKLNPHPTSADWLYENMSMQCCLAFGTPIGLCHPLQRSKNNGGCSTPHSLLINIKSQVY